MKKILSIASVIFTLCLCCLLSSCGNKGADELAFFLKDDGTYVVEIGEAKYRSEIEIPEKHNGKKVTEVGYFGHVGSGNDTLTKIIIPDSVTKIRAYAFSSCTSLSDITVPNSVTEIGEYAFYNCTAITTINLPDSLTEIGEMAFYNCTSLENIIIPDSIPEIKERTFGNCTKFSTVDIGNDVTKIGRNAFSNCTNLISVKLGNSVSEIASNAFESSEKIAEVINLSSLQFELGSSDHGSIAKNAIEIHKEEKSKIITKDEYRFITSGETNYLIDYIGSKTELILPDNYNNQKYEIRKNAFYSCSDLTNVVIGNGVTNIGEDAFNHCSKLKNVTIGNSVTSIGDSAFYYCNALEKITIPSSISKIDSWAFYCCQNLETVIIEKGVKEIASHAFFGCSKLIVLCYTGTENEWKSIKIDSYNSGLENVFIRYNYGK